MLLTNIPTDWATTVEIITPQLLKNAFGCWQQGRELPEALMNLQLMAGVAPKSLDIRSLWFFEYCLSITEAHLKACRMAVDLPHPDPPPLSRQALKGQVALDFNTGSGTAPPELSAWSALFHRYFLPIRIPPEELADAAGISARSMRRQRQLGLVYLARQLRKAELHAYQHIADGTTGSRDSRSASAPTEVPSPIG